MNMRCPYCEGKMRKGQLHAVGAGAGLEWKEGSESLRLNTDPELAARISGDRIAAYNCDFCRKIIVSYEYTREPNVQSSCSSGPNSTINSTICK